MQGASTQGKNALQTNQEKKLKLSELQELFEQQKSFSYITQEMIMLEQQLSKAHQWVQRVEEIREQDVVNLRVIQQVHADAKNIPVNFEDLMVEITKKKDIAEDLNKRIGDEIVIKKTRGRNILTEAPTGIISERKGGKRSVARETLISQEEITYGVSSDLTCGSLPPDRECVFRSLLEEVEQQKLISDNIVKLQNKMQEIERWKKEVMAVFQSYQIEEMSFNRFKDHYKQMLARS